MTTPQPPTSEPIRRLKKDPLAHLIGLILFDQFADLIDLAIDRDRLALASLHLADHVRFATGLPSLADQETAALPPESASTGPTDDAGDTHPGGYGSIHSGSHAACGLCNPGGRSCGHDPDHIENDDVAADEHERTCEQSLIPPDLLETMRDHLMEQMSRGIDAVDAAERINSLPTVVGLKDTGGASVTIDTLRDMGTSVNDIDPAAIQRALTGPIGCLIDEDTDSEAFAALPECDHCEGTGKNLTGSPWASTPRATTDTIWGDPQ